MSSPPFRLLSCVLFAVLLGAGPAPAQTPITDSPAKILNSVRTVIVAPDGGWTMTTHTETQILREAGITALSRTPLGYDDLLQQVEVTEAYVRKADGQMVAVPPEAIITEQNPATRNSPLMSDLKQKVIVYPGVEVGDTLVFTAVTHARPVFAGSFFFNALFPSLLTVDNASLTLTIPKSLPVTTDVRDLSLNKSVVNDNIVYSIRYANPKPVFDGLQGVSEFDRAARFSLSSFKDYDALARTYAAIAVPMIAVTPAIRNRADQITEGVGNHFEQARLIYQWVAGHVRHVPLEFGQGGVAPRSADSVLADVYGDSKDHAVLFAALLKAKGIDANLALVNASDSYSIARAPILNPFNRVITWLPEFRLYADTTYGAIVPFGLLPRGLYGKQVIHIADTRGALHQVPLADGKGSTDNYRLTIRMDNAGRIESESSSTGTGDFAFPLRLLGGLMQGDNSKTFAASILAKSNNNMARATGAVIASPPDADAADYRISSTYALPVPLGSVAAGGSLRLADELQLLSPVSANFYGEVLDERYKNSDPVPCFSGHSVDDETLEFPANRHLATLPEDSSVKTVHIAYTSHWSQTATSVNVHREFDAHFDTPVCSAWVRDEVLSAYARVQRDAATAIAVPRNPP